MTVLLCSVSNDSDWPVKVVAIELVVSSDVKMFRIVRYLLDPDELDRWFERRPSSGWIFIQKLAATPMPWWVRVLLYLCVIVFAISPLLIAFLADRIAKHLGCHLSARSSTTCQWGDMEIGWILDLMYFMAWLTPGTLYLGAMILSAFVIVDVRRLGGWLFTRRYRSSEVEEDDPPKRRKRKSKTSRGNQFLDLD